MAKADKPTSKKATNEKPVKTKGDLLEAFKEVKNNNEKPKKERVKRGKYDEKLAVKGTFLEIMQAAVKHADKNSGKNKKS